MRNFVTVFFVVLNAGVLLISGCQRGAEVEFVGDCQGKADVYEAFEALSARTGIGGPVRGSGYAYLVYFDQDLRRHEESFQVRLWMEPPSHIYLQGDIAFNPRALVLGSNAEQFWFWVRPEISTYWWGRWDNVEYIRQLPVSPRVIFEAVGFAGMQQADPLDEWSLHQQGDYDILTLHRAGRLNKKVYIEQCSYLPERIEYFGSMAELVAKTELGRYVELDESVMVPSDVNIVTFDGPEPFEANIRLDSVEATTFTSRQRDYLFTRPESRGFRNVYEIE